MKRTIMFGMIGIAILAILFISGCAVTGNAVVDTEADAEEYVKIPLSEVTDEVKFYSYAAGSVNINYFAVLGTDGEVRTAFDACDVCGGHLGYTQNGNDITCDKCGRVFSIDGLGTKNKGYGCWPSYLPHEVQGDEVLIKVSDITDGRERFV
ncbi:MAG: Fe-S-containing protein [archaeon]